MHKSDYVKTISFPSKDTETVMQILGMLDPNLNLWVEFQFDGENNVLICTMPRLIATVQQLSGNKAITIVECYTM
jgi:hypothetical protein